MDKYIEDILTECGRDSRNTGYVAISIEDALRYANWAQQMLQSKIAKKYPRTFLAAEKQNVTANTPSYTITDNLYLGTRLHLIRYYPSLTDDRVFTRVKPVSPYQRDMVVTGVPRYYERRGATFFMYPYPDAAGGRLEFIYERALDKLDLRRAQVNGTPSGTTVDLTHSTFGAPSATVEAMLTTNTYFSLCDAYGTVRLRNAVISSYNAATDAITTAANVSTYLVTGFALADLADTYLTIGKWTTTHSGLVNEAERYIAEYTTQRLFKRDSSNDAKEIASEMIEIEKDLLDAYKVPDMDAHPIPILDHEILIYGYSELEM